MNERQTVNGRAATVAYMLADFTPADASTAQLIKVMFDDGDLAMLVPNQQGLSLDRPPPPPFELRRASRREQTPHNTAIHGFTVAINEAEKHRRVLKRRFGYTDQQIGTMAMVHQSRLTRPK